ncbi:MAG: hypothetical protein A2189_01155 [Paenibacillus sp. RIFOXYA1_FULL_44_5]|nr:MAG: hypothetical protein A2189_01155 [Paenibacillus sp. RIFOXYA1_FULL_44_5]
MGFNQTDDENLLLLIEKARNCLIEAYQKHPSFSHPKVYRISIHLDKLIQLYLQTKDEQEFSPF